MFKRGSVLAGRVALGGTAGPLATASGYDPEPFSLRAPHHALLRLQSWIAVNRGLALKLGLKEAAAIASLEPHYFSAAFRKHVGVSFQEWRRQYRVLYAVQAIAHGRHQIAAVVALVGYRDRRSLERAIKDLTGTTPWRLAQGSQQVNSAGDSAVTRKHN